MVKEAANENDTLSSSSYAQIINDKAPERLYRTVLPHNLRETGYGQSSAPWKSVPNEPLSFSIPYWR